MLENEGEMERDHRCALYVTVTGVWRHVSFHAACAERPRVCGYEFG